MDAVRLLLDHDVPVDDEDSVRRQISLACPANVFCVGGVLGTGCWASSYRPQLGPGWVAQGIAVLGKLWPPCSGRCSAYLEQALFSDVSVLCVLAFSLHAQ